MSDEVFDDPASEPQPAPPPPKKRKPRKKKPKAVYIVRHSGKRYDADTYLLGSVTFTFTRGATTTYLPLTGPIEVTQMLPAQSVAAAVSTMYTQTYTPPPVQAEVDRFTKERNGRLASLSGFGTEFV